MPLFFEYNEAQKKETIDYINVRWGQLNELTRDWTDKAVKYLFVSNSGGAIATLSYIGNRQKAGFLLTTTLILFLAGVVLVGLFTSLFYHYIEGLFLKWMSDVKSYLSNNLKYEDLLTKDEKRASPKWWLYILAYASFGCFIIGIITGSINLLVEIRRHIP